ncbi:MAG: hypothetical protein ACI4JN_11185, partial [Ruminococcus sp.]
LPFSPEVLANWLKGAWLDILVMLFIFAAAVVRWHSCTFRIEDDAFCIEKGILMRQSIEIPLSRIVSAARSDVGIPLVMRLSILKIYTSAAKEDVLWLREKNCSEISQLLPPCKNDSAFHIKCRLNLSRVLLYSFLFSSSLTGTLYIAAFFTEAGNAAGEILSQLQATEALSEMSSAASRVFSAIPEIIVTILLILLLCRFLSFAVNFLVAAGFCVSADKHRTRVSSGIFPKRLVCTSLCSRECLILRQSILCRFTGKYSLFMTYPSCSSGRDKNSLIFPLLSKKSHFIPYIIKNTGDRIYSHPKAIWSFLWQPFLIMGVCSFLLFILSFFKPNAAEIFFPLSCIALFPAAALMLVRLITFRCQYFSVNDSSMTMHFCRKLSFFTLTADKENIALVKTTRSPMARKKGFCNTVFYMKGGVKAVLRGLKSNGEFL